MNEKPFPKPLPAEPLPLEEWLNRTDRAEVGREPFFRGRDREYDVFRRAANSLRAGSIGGGTMVFQGAPGSGKSALMAECMEAVRLHSTPGDPWIAVSLNPGSLRFPERVVRAMVREASAEAERSRNTSSGSIHDTMGKALDLGKRILREIPNRDISVGGVSWSGRDREVSAEGLFEHASEFLKSFRIVVFVDEAQNLRDDSMTRDVLDCLHRDPQGIPLVAAFFGLSDTQRVLAECGLSRLPRGRLVNLAPLLPKDASGSIRGVFDAYGFTGIPEDRETWVGQLAELSQGWPQHVNSVSIAASTVIRDNEGRIAAEYLGEAITLAEGLKDEYYEGRIAAGSCDSWVYRQLALAAKERDGGLSRHEIGQLTEFARREKSQTVDDFVTDALHAGLLAPAHDVLDFYVIPIPSLSDHLCALNVRTPEEFRK